MASQQQPFWSESDQRWLSVTFDTKYQRSYRPESTSGPTEYHREEGPRVFSVLFAQSAGDTAMTNYNHDAITTGRYGETVHAQIRRFIVVQQKREFCFAV
ncbi:hypothetical protein CFE70_004825 [Pyrenophora teres f. teres 0-1]